MTRAQEVLLQLRGELDLSEQDHAEIVRRIISGEIPDRPPPPPPAPATAAPARKRSAGGGAAAPRQRAPRPPGQPRQRSRPAAGAGAGGGAGGGAGAPPPPPPTRPSTAPRPPPRPRAGVRETLLGGSAAAASFADDPDLTLIGRALKKKRPLPRDKADAPTGEYRDGIVYDFDVDSLEHLVVYEPGESTEEHEWFNVLAMSDRVGVLLSTCTPVAELPRSAAAPWVAAKGHKGGG